MRRSFSLLIASIPMVAGCGVPAREEFAASAPSPESRATIERFCGDCHGLPLAESFPRDRWPAEVRQGYDFYRRAGRSDLRRPVELDAVRYFQEQAPETLVTPAASDVVERPAPILFTTHPLPEAFSMDGPAIAGLLWRESRGELLASDMRHGTIERWTLVPGRESLEVVARLPHPCRIVPLGSTDGRDAFCVSDLGSFLPADHAAGAVWSLEETADGFSTRMLREGLARMVEARPLTMNDASAGLVAAEFGWRETGALRILDVRGDASRDRILDPRHGVVAAMVADMDGDGRDDVVAAFGQEHETVDVYWGRGDGTHDHALVHAFPDPSWGSSGLHLADIDGDGLTDILHANGDTLDSGLARPSHGIRWIRNHGDRSFTIREIGAMPGVCQASTADLDRDGDLDVVACSLHQASTSMPAGTFNAVAWFEQLPDHTFTIHTIERDTCLHAACAAVDVDDDGWLDVVVGMWVGDDGSRRLPRATVYRNMGSVMAASGRTAPVERRHPSSRPDRPKVVDGSNASKERPETP